MTRAMEATLLLDCRHHLAEGPVWHRGALWWVDITAGTLHTLDPENGRHESRTPGGLLGCAVPCADGRWLLARDTGFFFFDWETGALNRIAGPADGEPGVRFNDGKCDPLGNFLAGTIHLGLQEGAAALYQMDASLRTRRLFGGVTISNGLAWSADGRRMYYTDTWTRRLDVFDRDPATGELANRRPLVRIPEGGGFPDGMDLDAEGNLWVALWGASAVACYHGDTGAELARVTLPVSQPSSCVFGGADFSTLFITTARQDLPPEELAARPVSGGIFTARPGVRGRPPHLFSPSPHI